MHLASPNPANLYFSTKNKLQFQQHKKQGKKTTVHLLLLPPIILLIHIIVDFMDVTYGLYSTLADYSDKALMSPDNLIFPLEYHSYVPSENYQLRIPILGSEELTPEAASISTVIPREEDVSPTPIKTKILSHPCYPRLLQAYIDCQKVGAPPEIAFNLEAVGQENEFCNQDIFSWHWGADPELDAFMETYCNLLAKYKSDLERPFNEATTFLNKIEMQLRNLCAGASIRSLSDEGAPSSDDELSAGELDVHDALVGGDDESGLKDKLLRRFGSRIGTLKLEFSKKKKKGNLPKEARQTLLEWWSVHYKWPYPTEADKIALAESTGLDQKQINNWFINQRKRHWKPSNNVQLEQMDDLSGQYFTQD